MPKFSKKSLAVIDTIDERLKKILIKAIEVVDFSVISGHRTPDEQLALFKQGRKYDGFGWNVANKNMVVTNCDGINIKSKHNEFPSKAVDIVPYPSMWSDSYKLHYLAGVMMAIAKDLNINLKWGGDFKTIKDLPHFEL